MTRMPPGDLPRLRPFSIQRCSGHPSQGSRSFLQFFRTARGSLLQEPFRGPRTRRDQCGCRHTTAHIHDTYGGKCLPSSRQKVKTGQIRKLHPLALRPGREFLPTFFPAQARRIYFKIRITLTKPQSASTSNGDNYRLKPCIRHIYAMAGDKLSRYRY